MGKAGVEYGNILTDEEQKRTWVGQQHRQ